jgi:uncharacterized protein involved in type VI secretion and phage assembly
MLELIDIRERATERKRLFGVYPAVVTDVRDEDGQGRVKVRLPWSPDDDAGYAVWARLATMMAGGKRGSWFIPDKDDEVLVAFEGGDPRRPYVVGALWNGKDAPPDSMDSNGDNNRKVIASRRNIRITLDDTQGSETVTIETPGGQKLTLKDGTTLVELRDSSSHVIKLEAGGITISGDAKVTIKATDVEVSGATLTVNCSESTFNGHVTANAISTQSIDSKMYSPGVGNIW